MADAELNVMLSGLSLGAILETSGNVLHITLDGTGISATASVTASAFSNSTLEDVTSIGSVNVKAQASLSKGLDNISSMAFGEVYTGINSPYEDVVSWTGHPLSGSTVKVRLGNLRGIFGENGEFGLYAGDGWDAKSGLPPNVNSQYIRLGNKANEFHNVPVKLYDGNNVTIQLEPISPSFAMGNPLPTGYNTGIGLWQGKDTDGIYKWRVGNPSGSNLSWNGTNLLLQNASLDVSGSNVHIALGNPPPTSKTSGTGIWMDNSGIYGLHNNVKQVYIDTTTGIFYSGAGTVRVDEAGANIVIGTHDGFNRLTGVELNSTGLFGKVADDVRFALANTGIPFLKLGTGTKDVDLTGIQIDSNEMVGQDNGVTQARFGVDGKIYAANDKITLDNSGIIMEDIGNFIRFKKDDFEIGTLGVLLTESGDPQLRLGLGQLSATNLMPNGSFSTLPINWDNLEPDSSTYYSAPRSGVFSYSSTIILNSAYLYNMYGKAIAASDTISLSEGRYKLTAMVRSAFTDPTDPQLLLGMISINHPSIPTAVYGRSDLFWLGPTDNPVPWNKIEFDFAIHSSNFKVALTLLAYQPLVLQGDYGDIWLDDIVINKYGDNSSINFDYDKITLDAPLVSFTSFPTTPSSSPTSDYQVANKAYVDKLGTWQSWTPTITYTGGSGTPTSLSTVARYCKIGKLVHIYISAAVVRGSCTQAYINFTLPTAAARRFTAFGVHTIITADWSQGMGLGNAGTPGTLSVRLGGAMARDGYLWVSAFYEET